LGFLAAAVNGVSVPPYLNLTHIPLSVQNGNLCSNEMYALCASPQSNPDTSYWHGSNTASDIEQKVFTF
jgi:hypothetical protein